MELQCLWQLRVLLSSGIFVLTYTQLSLVGLQWLFKKLSLGAKRIFPLTCFGKGYRSGCGLPWSTGRHMQPSDLWKLTTMFPCVQTFMLSTSQNAHVERWYKSILKKKAAFSHENFSGPFTWRTWFEMVLILHVWW